MKSSAQAKRASRFTAALAALLLTLGPALPAAAWHDETHLAVAKAAGYAKWYNATGADMAKEKAGDVEKFNHYCNTPLDFVVTPELVLAQKASYNSPADPHGHLYGAILGALEEFRRTDRLGKYAQYHLAFAAHYLADLSQPLHNMPYDAFNRRNHSAVDGTVEDEVLANLQKIRKRMTEITIRPEHFEADLAREVALLANDAKKLGAVMKKENRLLTRKEAYRQLARSASLLRAVLRALEQSPPIAVKTLLPRPGIKKSDLS